MSLNVRFKPRANVSALWANGNNWPVGSAAYVDVPENQADAIGPDQGTRLCYVGATADRPAAQPGRVNWPMGPMFDTDLSKVIWPLPGTVPVKWVDAEGNPPDGPRRRALVRVKHAAAIFAAWRRTRALQPPTGFVDDAGG
jgi:hypothetical protein